MVSASAEPSTNPSAETTNLNESTQQPESTNLKDPSYQNVKQPNVTVAIAGPAFDVNHPKYRCCCGCMHVKAGAITIGILELIFAVLSFCNYFLTPAYASWSVIYLVTNLLQIPVAICLIVGAFIQNQYLLLPYMVMSIIHLICSILVVILILIPIGHLGANVGLGVLLILLILCSIALLIWFNWIVYKCYVYFRDRKCHLATGVAITAQIH